MFLCSGSPDSWIIQNLSDLATPLGLKSLQSFFPLALKEKEG